MTNRLQQSDVQQALWVGLCNKCYLTFNTVFSGVAERQGGGPGPPEEGEHHASPQR